MEHYNSVARTLMERPDRYSPLFSVDTRNGDILWELWIEGFETAVELRPEAWQKLLNADADTAAAMRGMMALADVVSAINTCQERTLMPSMRRPPKISPVGSSRSMNGGLPMTSQCRASIRERPRPPRKRSAEMIPVRAAQEKNTRDAADLTKCRHRGVREPERTAARWIRPMIYLDQFRGSCTSAGIRFLLEARSRTSHPLSTLVERAIANPLSHCLGTCLVNVSVRNCLKPDQFF